MNSASPPEQRDAIVVGASVAGLTVAEELGREGWDVLILERKPDFAAPGRTWIVTPRMETLTGALPPEVAVHRTGTMEMFAGPARAAVPLDPPDLIVERPALLEHLASRARSAGAGLRTGADVREVRRLDRGFEITVTGPDGEGERRIRARHLVGADGTRSTVARTFRARPQDTVPIVQARVELPDGYDPDVTRVWFHRPGTRFFYWLIPDSPDHGVAGLVPESPGTARDDLARFLERHQLRPLEYQGAVIPLHQPFRRIHWRFGESRVLLVGDAAAHVKVTTVGGVVSGIWGAQAAARALVGDAGYGKELRALHRELWLHDLIRWSMDRFDQRAYVRLLEMMNEPLRELLSTRDRDSMAGAVWTLLRAQPGILGLGVRSLLRPYRGEAGSERHRRPLLSAPGAATARKSQELSGD